MLDACSCAEKGVSEMSDRCCNVVPASSYGFAQPVHRETLDAVAFAMAMHKASPLRFEWSLHVGGARSNRRLQRKLLLRLPEAAVVEPTLGGLCEDALGQCHTCSVAQPSR